MPCNSISLIFKRNIKMQEIKKTTSVQVVALAKGNLKKPMNLKLWSFVWVLEPCDDEYIFFRCRKDYPYSCIDKRLQCNGRSECPSGDDERDCHCMLLISIFIMIRFSFI